MSEPGPGHAQALIELLRRRGCAPGSVVVDLVAGGDGSVVAALRASGLLPIGVAADRAGAERLAALGAEVVTGDLSDPDAVFESLVLAAGERRVAAVWLGDLPARAHDMAALVRATHWFGEQTGAPLALGVPNVTHVDVGTKLLLGRWEPRPGGVLDDAHVRRFSATSLRSTMAALGWAEVDAEDVELAESDQHFPADAAPLERTTPSGARLAALRELAGPGAYVAQLVRLYEAVMPEPPGPADDAGSRGAAGAAGGRGDGAGGEAPFLSVLVRTQGKRFETLQETLLSLAAQSCAAFEVLVIVHDPEPGVTGRIEELVAEFHPSFASRVRVVEVVGGGRCRPLNLGAQKARGHYLATLDDDDLVFAHWVETLRAAAARAPGHALRVGVATQQIAAAPAAWAGEDGYDVLSRPRVDYPLTFDHIAHLRDNLTPNNGYAVPRWVVTELGQNWDESLPVLEDWDHLLRSAEICGVADSPTVAAMLRVWANAESSKTVHPPEVWEETRRRIVAQRDAQPLLLDTGYVSRLHKLLRRLDGVPELELQLEQREQEMAQLRDEIARLTGEAARLAGELAHAHSAIDQLHAEAGQLRDEIARLTGEATRLAGELAHAHSAIDQLHAEAGQLRDEIARLAGELAVSENRRRIADESAAALETARADLQARLDEVLASRSWRLTEALRKGTGAARRVAGAPERLLRRHDGRGGTGTGGTGGTGG
jgi:hypothetical protein